MQLPVRAMLAAQFFSILGSAIGALAIPWLLFEAHLSPERIALLFAVQSGAALLAALLGTPLVDRIDKRKAYIVCDLLLALASFSLVGLYLAHALHPLIIALILAIAAVLSAFASAAGSAMIPGLLQQQACDHPDTHQRVNGWIGVFHNFGDLAGPIIGGLCIAALGSAGALALDGATFLLSALLLFVFLPRMSASAAHPASTHSEAGQAHGRNDYLAGVREIMRSPVLRMVSLISAVINLSLTPLLALLLPVLVKQAGGSALGAGVLISCFGGGALLASLLISLRPLPWPAVYSLCGSPGLMLLCFVLLPFSSGLSSCFLLFLLGLAVGYLGPLEQTLMQSHAPQQHVGRVMLAYSALRTVPVPLGYFICSLGLAQANLAASLHSLAALLALALAALLYSAWREKTHWRPPA
ncbi:MFS transporter [Massilia sp. W12]|uniref:MFS transporter n=1 Tax=Massilia sp. W12 TaxID=3126507 RepID=UPI0030D142AA